MSKCKYKPAPEYLIVSLLEEVKCKEEEEDSPGNLFLERRSKKKKDTNNIGLAKCKVVAVGKGARIEGTKTYVPAMFKVGDIVLVDKDYVIETESDDDEDGVFRSLNCIVKIDGMFLLSFDTVLAVQKV